MKHVAAALFVLLIVAPVAHAARHVLFLAPYMPARGYNDIAVSLTAGDTVVFSNGTTRNVVRLISNESTTVIFENEYGHASRINKNAYTYSKKNYLDETMKGYPALVAAGASVVRLYEETYIPGEHVEAELLETDHILASKWLRDFEQCIKTPSRCSTEDLQNYSRMRRELVVFLSGFAAFASVGDFSSWQVAYSHGRWILFDWTAGHRLATNIRDKERVLSIFLPDAQYSDLPFLTGITEESSIAFFEARSRRCVKALIRQHD